MQVEETLKRIDLAAARDRIMDQMHDCLKAPEAVLYLWEYVLGAGADLVSEGGETYLEYLPSTVGEQDFDD